MTPNCDHRYQLRSVRVNSGLRLNALSMNANTESLTKLASDIEVESDTKVESVTMVSLIVPESVPQQSELPSSLRTPLTLPQHSLPLLRPCSRPLSPPVSRRAQVGQKSHSR